MRRKFEDLLLRSVRFYTYNTPVSKGKYRIFLAAMNACEHVPERRVVPTKDGRRFWVDFTTGMHNMVYFLGEYEKALTDLTVALIRDGDVCLDVGANFGWYTSIFHKYAGTSGEVHSFEPVPPTYHELSKNYDLMGRPGNVHLNDLGLGDKPAGMTVNLFPGLTTGHASLSDQGRNDAVQFECRVIALDSYLTDNGIEKVNFVKVDIEGAELMFLKGAEKLFAQKVPPVLLMEMALKATQNFGYVPDDLINFISSRAAYDFYKIDELNHRLFPISGFNADDIGANVICIPGNFERPRALADWLAG